MHPIQKKLLDTARAMDINNIRQSELVKIIGCDYPSQIAHHLKQLVKNGYLVMNEGKISLSTKLINSMVRIPVMGEADCGEATRFADNQVMDTVTVSAKQLKSHINGKVFALIARGDSMNKAKVNGKEICNGDYIIVRKRDGYQPKNKDIVVSNIGGMANVKLINFDNDNDRIILSSESYDQGKFLPIIIYPNDEFSIEGEVVDIIKALNI